METSNIEHIIRRHVVVSGTPVVNELLFLRQSQEDIEVMRGDQHWILK